MFSTPVKRLREAVGFCAKAAPRTATIDILKTLHLSASENGMSIVATDLDLWATADVEGQYVDDFAVCVPAADFAAFCAHAPSSGDVVFEFRESTLRMSSEGATADLPTADPTQFPAPKALPKLGIVEPEFADALASAIPASFHGDYAPSNATDGVLLDGDQCVGYDGKRLVVACVPCAKGAVIPREYAARISKLLSDGGSFGVSDTMWHAAKDGMTLSGRLREGQFPQYRSNTDHPEVMNAPSVARFSRDNLVQAIKRATLADRRGVKIQGDKSGIRVSTFYKGTTAKLQADASSDCEGEVLADFVTHLDSGFALDALFAMPDADVVLSHKSSSPQIAIFRPAERSAFLDRAAYVSEMRA